MSVHRVGGCEGVCVEWVGMSECACSVGVLVGVSV